MKDEYEVTKSTIALIQYHLAFCPRYRRKIFRHPGVEERLRELTKTACDRMGAEILDLRCEDEFVYLYVRVRPDLSAADVVKKIKIATASIREEFLPLSSMTSLWTKNFFASTSEEQVVNWVRRFVVTQKKRL